MEHEELGQLWWQAKEDDLHLVVTALIPSPKYGCNFEVTGYVIGRGSKYCIHAPELRKFIEDVRAEWITAAWLVNP
ncbi:hypothetical protein [Streptomyces sp. NPDC047097]|uniref:hypothetical protein n=1 Tax=Streptomyces sp. NPDC047097 TaxID=3155260 RepID=UPI0033DB6B0D